MNAFSEQIFKFCDRTGLILSENWKVSLIYDGFRFFRVLYISVHNTLNLLTLIKLLFRAPHKYYHYHLVKSVKLFFEYSQFFVEILRMRNAIFWYGQELKFEKMKLWIKTFFGPFVKTNVNLNNAFNCDDAFLHNLVICSSKFSFSSITIPSNLTLDSDLIN